MEWKKRENAIYKFRALFDGLLRGEYIDTPQSIYNSIKKKIPNKELIEKLVDPDSNKALNLRNHKDLMKYLIRKGILLPYSGRINNEDIVMFSTDLHKDAATSEWDIQPVSVDDAP